MGSFSYFHLRFSLIFTLLFIPEDVSGARFTFVNKCDFTVWPGILGSPKLSSSGFQLTKGSSRSFQAPTGWSGRFWGRTGCNFDGSGRGSCVTADCSSGQVECNGAGAAPPATLVELTLGSGSKDFYDVSLVDGYNLPMAVEASGGSGGCESPGCSLDLNWNCPAELRVEGGSACRSACDAFKNPEYCCSGAYASPSTCKPSTYSQLFKSACPTSYSYAYDDATSTFTCTGADYTITFCSDMPSLKSSSVSPPKATEPAINNDTDSDTGAQEGSESASVEQATLVDAWIASLAAGNSARIHPFWWVVQYAFVLATSLILCSCIWKELFQNFFYEILFL